MRHADLVVDHVEDPTVDHVKDPAVDLVEDLAVDQDEDQDLGPENLNVPDLKAPEMLRRPKDLHLVQSPSPTRMLRTLRPKQGPNLAQDPDKILQMSRKRTETEMGPDRDLKIQTGKRKDQSRDQDRNLEMKLT